MYAFVLHYIARDEIEPSWAFVVVIIVMDILLFLSLVYQTVFSKSVYCQDIFGKVYGFVRVLVAAGAQSILIELYIYGTDPRQGKTKPFSALSFASYFVLGSTTFVVTILSLRTCFRGKDSHPLGERITEAAFAASETARKVSQLVCILLLGAILAFNQVYLAGLADHFQFDDNSLLKRSSIIFSGVFIGLSVFTAYAEKHFK